MKKIKILIIAIIAATVFCSCTRSTGQNVDREGVSSVKWILPCATQEDNNLVYNEANKLIEQKLGLTVNFMPVDFGSYNEKMQVINAAQDQYDICYTSNWLNNYYQNIEQGNLLDISESLPKYAPETYASIKKEFWDGIKINGKLYGVINQQIMAREPGFAIPKVFVEKYNIDTSAVKTVADLEEIAKMVQVDNPECNQISGFWSVYSEILGYENITNNSPAVIKTNSDGVPTVLNMYETDDYKDYIKMRKRWVDEKISMANLSSEKDAVATVKNNKITAPFSLVGTYKPGVEQEMYSKTNIEPVFIHVVAPMLTTSGVASTLTAVSSTTVDEEASLKVINLINTDKDVYNMLSFGIEGRHYKKIGDNRIELSNENRYIVANWAIGNVFNSYLYGDQSDDVWEETDRINNEALLSPIYGFVPDVSNINIQLANCTTVCNEYTETLDQGIGNVDEMYAKFISKLKSAGVDTIIKELQNQINDWYEKNRQ